MNTPLQNHGGAIHDEHDEGLAFDMARLLSFAAPPPRLLDRRRLLFTLAGGAGATALLAACGSGSTPTAAATAAPSTPPPSTPTTAPVVAPTSTSTATAAPDPTAAPTETAEPTATETPANPGAEIPDETAGPYPGDGTNGPNALADSGVVRNDIRTSFGTAGGTTTGITTVFELTIVDADSGSPLPGAAVYLWHCDRDGQYSMYDIAGENYLRGVQVADAGGRMQFTSVFPGCYSGRWPHAHFEVFASLDEATNGRQAIKTTQLALPEVACAQAYTTAGYETSVSNLSRNSLDSDMVFRDGYGEQLATVSGDNATGYTASLTVRI